MLEAGKLIHDRYLLEFKLGRNTGKQTWLARDLQKHNKEQVVIKLLAFGGDIVWSDLRLFEKEAQILKQLDRPNIPQYKDYFAIDDRILWFALVQEYIPGSSLKELLDRGKRFSESEIDLIATEILETLIYLHELNPPLLHQDIKPSNLILSHDKSLYLVDFAAVQENNNSQGSKFTIVGTYGYTPIEQFGGKAVPASDLYAVGVTLIHLLTRTAPTDLPNQDLKIQFRPQATISSKLANWLDRMTAPALEKRFISAKQALLSLKSDVEAPHNIIKNKPFRSPKEGIKPFNTEISLEFSTTSLEVIIPMRGEFLLPDHLSRKTKNTIIFSLLCGLFPLIMLVQVLSDAASRMILLWGLFFFPFFAFFLYYLLKYLFSSSKLTIDSHQFTITNFFLWWQKSKIGNTEYIKDVSINYTNILQNSQNIQKLVGDSIILSTKGTDFSSKFQHYYFGKGLSDNELLWLVNEIRRWLAANSKI